MDFDGKGSSYGASSSNITINSNIIISINNYNSIHYIYYINNNNNNINNNNNNNSINNDIKQINCSSIFVDSSISIIGATASSTTIYCGGQK